MPPKPKKPNNDFYDMFSSIWNQNGGLVRPIEAGKILSVTESQISKNWKAIGLERIEIEGKDYITWSSLCKIYEERKEKNL